MAAKTFNCPTCGGPLDYDGGAQTTIHCPFCNNLVVVPEEIRSGKPPITVSVPHSNSRTTISIAAIITFVLILTAGVVFAVLSATMAATNNSVQDFSAVESTGASSTVAESPTDTPEPSSTPAYANPKVSFGEEGIGPGQFNDARYLAIDGDGILYVADYQGGRIQAFDASGKYLRQFTVGNSKTIIHGMTANHEGKVFIAAGHVPDILEYDGKTGQSLGKLTASNGGEFGEMFATANGGLAATWYEGRWGIITSLEGHRDDLVLFDAQGKIGLTIPSFISNQTGDLALDNYVTVDGLRRIFVLSDGVVYAFSPEGQYLDKFGSIGDQPGQFNYPRAIIVDGQGRIYVGDTRAVHVFTADGRFVTDFPTLAAVESMVIDEKGTLWVLGGEKVTQYVRQE